MRMNLMIASVLLISSLSNVSAKTINGEKMSLGNGNVYSYAVTSENGIPQSLGIALTEEALNGLSTVDQTFMIPLPTGVEIPPYKYVMINWNPHGHEPENIYGLPHFDFHFYALSDLKREAISCMGDDAAICTKMPEANYLPKYYIPTPAGVPQMGWHWLDSRSPELNGKRFTSTFIDGFYNGKMIFVEPMITREFLLSKTYLYQELSMPKNYYYRGYYPGAYVVKYDSDKKVYRIILKNLEKID